VASTTQVIRTGPSASISGDQRTVARFEEELAGIPGVVLAQRLFGEPDYLLRVRCRDAADYQRIRDSRLATLPGVGRLSSTLVMKDVIRDRALERSG
jgi:DNA-binding Lrp family transcriptional regulator